MLYLGAYYSMERNGTPKYTCVSNILNCIGDLYRRELAKSLKRSHALAS